MAEKGDIEAAVPVRDRLGRRLCEVHARGVLSGQPQEVGIHVDADHGQAALRERLGEHARPCADVDEPGRSQPLRGQGDDALDLEQPDPLRRPEAVSLAVKAAIVLCHSTCPGSGRLAAQRSRLLFPESLEDPVDLDPRFLLGLVGLGNGGS